MSSPATVCPRSRLLRNNGSSSLAGGAHLEVGQLLGTAAPALTPAGPTEGHATHELWAHTYKIPSGYEVGTWHKMSNRVHLIFRHTDYFHVLSKKKGRWSTRSGSSWSCEHCWGAQPLSLGHGAVSVHQNQLLNREQSHCLTPNLERVCCNTPGERGNGGRKENLTQPMEFGSERNCLHPARKIAA